MSKGHSLRELQRFGVSVWYDNISRGLLSSGELSRLLAEDGVRGVTSNPTIFDKAIASSQDYDEAIRPLAEAGKSPAQIFEALAVDDIRAAADVFRPLYEETRHSDGFVSLELPPALARDASGSHAEAVRLFNLVGRPNVMIKIPGTLEGLEAFEEAIADGIPVNVTLLFSRERHAETVEAYLRGLERRAKRKKRLEGLASVASFFVSRIDTAVDAELERVIAAAPARAQEELRALLGKAAVANARLAYQTYKREFLSPRFAKLKAQGASPQRLLWASTGTKNPAYRDVVYVEELIGPDTVNTMPPPTLAAFRDHGVCRPSLEEDMAGAGKTWEALLAAGVDLPGITRRLEEEGVEAFAKSFETLLGRLAAKKEALAAESGVVEAGLERLAAARFSERLWLKDAALWKKEPQAQRQIKNALGWLSLPDAMAATLGTLRSFSDEVRREGFTRAVVLGMGGSSLAVEVLRTCFSPAQGFLRVEVLDSTHPGAVRALRERLDLPRTLFIVASKSGSTIEPNCFLDYFFAEASRASPRPGRQFVAVTDPGTSLEKAARAQGFRRVFTSPADVGGRYSALSVFGLLPAALMGLDLARLLDSARQAARTLQPSVLTHESPALRLGAALGSHADKGQDKLTLSLSPAIESLGLWIAQLVAESTGKEGRGIAPVAGELPGPPASYGRDRLFVRVALEGSPDAEAEERLAVLESAGHPVLEFKLKDAYDLGGQFFLWEAATAAAGFLLGVNPFDQPDVQAAKDRTGELLASLKKGSLPPEKADLRAGGLAAFCDPDLRRRLAGGASKDRPLRDVLSRHLERLAPGDYCVLLAYLEPSTENRLLLEKAQRLARELTTCPVSLEWGPRYLHSTGQLHKGGSGAGLFLLLTDSPAKPLPIPGRDYAFAALVRAQARGDFAALLAAGRRALRLDLGALQSGSLASLPNALSEIVPSRACPS